MPRPSRIALALVVAVVLAVPAACAARSGEAAPVTVDASQSGTAVALAPGARLVVRLDGNPTTGYSWTWAEPTSDVVAPDGAPAYEPDAHATGVVGSGGTQVFTFTARAPGARTLRFVYARPWEKDTPPARTVTYDVTVR